MASDTDTQQGDAPFQIRSLIGQAGVGSNGEKLVNALTSLYPDELTNAQLRTPNNALTKGLDFGAVSKIAGDGIDVRDAVVRGGERHEDDAVVTFAGYDEAGDTVKGAFPFSDLGKSSSSGLILQSERLQASDAARDYRAAQAKADAAASGAGASGDPIAAYEDWTAQQVVAYLDDNPDRVEVIQALESATKGKQARKSIMEWTPPEADDSGDDSAPTG